ncbi:MAG: hypothetical protein AAFZ52_05020 [Bacteroidota bacterium]
MHTNDLYAEEIQYSRWWMIAPMLVGVVGLILTLTFAAVDREALPIALLITVSSILPTLLLGLGKLKLRFTKDSFSYAFLGMVPKIYFREDIVDMEVIDYDFSTAFPDYNPLHDKNLIMGGQYALRMKTKAGKTIVLTTRQPRELRQFVTDWLAGTEKLDLNNHPVTLDLQRQPQFSERDLV